MNMSGDEQKQKIGPNDPCFCGSGKKYKKCCWQDNSPQRTNILDFEWTKIRQVESAVNTKLAVYGEPFAEKHMAEAWSDFFATENVFPEEFYEAMNNALFLNWFFYSWVPLKRNSIVKRHNAKPIAFEFLKANETLLSSLEKRFIQARMQTYYSFYAILKVTPNEVYLRDILLDREIVVKELRHGGLAVGGVMFTGIFSLDGHFFFVSTAPYALTGHHHSSLIDLRDVLIEECGGTLTEDHLRNDCDVLLRSFFFHEMVAMFAPPYINLTNTDGDPVMYCKVFFKLHCSVQIAFEKLLPLALDLDLSEFLESAEKNKNGEITQIEVPWFKPQKKKGNKSLQYTLMGTINIMTDRIVVEVNSQNRAKKIQTVVKKHMGDLVTYYNMVLESPEQLEKRLGSSKEESNAHTRSAEEDALIVQMADQHWTEWFDIKIPMLKNQTPRQAAKTKAGRERLEALLLEYQRRDKTRDSGDPFAADIEHLRNELGL